MTKMKIGLLVMGLLGAVACGDSGDKDEPGSTAGNGETSGANAPDKDDGGDPPSNEDGGGSNGGSNGTTNGTSNNGSTSNGDDAGGTGGAEGACTNAADMAIITASSPETLGCEGAACAGKNIMNASGQTMCIAKEAPGLKQLSPACQKCFDDITTCVPGKCVQLLGGEDACPISLPNTDFSKCKNPPETVAKCADCSKRLCQPAFSACSGLK